MEVVGKGKIGVRGKLKIGVRGVLGKLKIGIRGQVQMELLHRLIELLLAFRPLKNTSSSPRISIFPAFRPSTSIAVLVSLAPSVLSQYCRGGEGEDERGRGGEGERGRGVEGERGRGGEGHLLTCL